MKKIYAILGLMLAFGTGAFAQRHCDVEILPLIGPANNSNYSCTGQVLSGYYFINNGPDAILSTDSFQLFDANMDNAAEGADPLNFASFFYFSGFPTGLQINGLIGDSVRSTPMDIPAHDTLIFYQWSDTLQRLSTLILADTYAISDDGNSDTMDYYVFTPAGQAPANGTYLWPVVFAGFYGSDVVDTVITNNIQFSKITINCVTSIHDVNYNKMTFTAYPNPTSNTVHFNYNFTKATTVSASIMDMTGRRFKTIDLGRAGPGDQKYTIDVNALAPGTYLLEVTTGDSRGMAKFTKN
jgi:hypothetical protein